MNTLYLGDCLYSRRDVRIDFGGFTIQTQRDAYQANHRAKVQMFTLKEYFAGKRPNLPLVNITFPEDTAYKSAKHTGLNILLSLQFHTRFS